MIKHEDGSVTLTKSEFAQLNKAYQGLYSILNNMPSSIQDYFDTHAQVMNVFKWSELLQGKKFNRKDFE